MNLIYTYEEFILNETLKTTNIDLTIKNVNTELSLLQSIANKDIDFNNLQNNNDLKYKYSLNIIDSYNDTKKISLTIYNVNSQNSMDIYIDNINSLLIDRHGWFPSEMIRINTYNMKLNSKYNRETLFKSLNNIKELTLIYEAKYDEFEIYNGELYHLTINQYINDIENIGLIPKDNSKLTYHPSRIYVCKDILDCKKLISRIKFLLIDEGLLKTKSNKNIEWCIFKINNNIDIKLYKDPNFKKGYFILENIHPNNLELIEQEIC